jgi:hypothetical protein
MVRNRLSGILDPSLYAGDVRPPAADPGAADEKSRRGCELRH